MQKDPIQASSDATFTSLILVFFICILFGLAFRGLFSAKTDPSDPPDRVNFSEATYSTETEEESHDCGDGIVVTSTQNYSVIHFGDGSKSTSIANFPEWYRLCISARSKAGLRCVDIHQKVATEKGTLALDMVTQETCKLNTETGKFEPLK